MDTKELYIESRHEMNTIVANIEEPPSMDDKDVIDSVKIEPDLNLSPEEGSLYHSFHQKSENEKIMDNSTKKTNASKFKREKYHINMNEVLFGTKYKGKCSRLEITDQLMAQEDLIEHVNKTFYLKSRISNDHWELPRKSDVYFSKLMYKDEQLQEMKNHLNSVKAELEVYDITTWHQHTHTVNPAAKIPAMVRSLANPELVTQAFIKFFEILHKFDVIPKRNETSSQSDTELRTLHLCEAPGAFILALNHYLSLEHPLLKEKWTWMGNTLNPYFEGTPSSQCITDDRFILHTFPNWFFGKDGTGDILSPKYIDELISVYAGNKRKVNLVTADGSIDCQGKPAEQEDMTYLLQVAEVTVALSVLENGGSFVLKRFTSFECGSFNLLYFLCCAFDQVAVHKPIASKSGNSETYVICTGYQSSELVDACLLGYRTILEEPVGKSLLYPEHIPEKFLNSVRDCCKFFDTHQIKAIKRNIDLYHSKCLFTNAKRRQYSEFLKDLVSGYYSDQFNCTQIEEKDKLVSNLMEWDRHVSSQSVLKWGEQITKMSKADRIEFLDERLSELVDCYTTQLNESGTIDNNFVSFDVHRQGSRMFEWEVLTGKKFNLVYISRLCNSVALQAYVKYFQESLSQDNLNAEKLTNNVMHNPSVMTKIKKSAKDKAIALINQSELSAGALIIDEGDFVGPHNQCKAFEELISLISQNKLKENEDVVIINAPLLTRLQAGLLCVLRNFFYKTYVQINLPQSEFMDFYPIILLKKFSPREDSSDLLSELAATKWNSDTVDGRAVHQILDIKSLVTGNFHAPLCLYNTSYVLWNASLLKLSHYVFGEDELSLD